MTLSPGSRFDAYEIVGPLGAGGMGEVYRARDHKLGRDVAIKILPAAFATDPDRLMRFEREARTLASLNHPNIAQIYGQEHFGEMSALVLEFVDGPTLADRIRQRPIDVQEIRDIVTQICAALTAAHDLGIVHRDLKPANIKLRSDGTVKVLDFGLAKLAAIDAQAGGATATVTSPATMRGDSRGTAAYMSPEQARGQTVDKRTDIWALGCVMFEMLTGASPFAATTTTDAIAAVVTKEPAWQHLPPSTPSEWRALLQRCLEKNVNQRLRDAGDACLLLESPGAVTVAVPRRRWWLAVAAVAGVAAIAGGYAAGRLSTGRGAADPSPLRFQLSVPDVQSLADSRFAITANGERIAYVVTAPAGRRLFVRALSEETPRALDAVQPSEPFFSPDGDTIGFIGLQRLQVVRLSTGLIETVCSVAGNFFGGTFSPDGNSIVYSSGGQLFRVNVAGGEPVRLRIVGEGRSGRYPQLLPDGNGILFASFDMQRNAAAEIIFHDFTSGQSTVIGNGADVRYLASGHVAILRGTSVYVSRFDPRSPGQQHPQTLVASNVSQTSNTGGTFAITPDRLIYVVNLPSTRRRFVVVDRKGGVTPLDAPAGNYQQPRVSPDGTRFLAEDTSQVHSIWTYVMATGVLTKVSMAGASHNPIWSADGQRVTYNAGREAGEVGSIYMKAADGSGREERIVAGTARSLSPLSWSKDGAFLFVDESIETNRNLLLYDIRARGEPKPWLATRDNEAMAVISPDGQWVAYVSNVSRRDEVYVRPLADAQEGLWQVSTDGGSHPVWSRTGRELFYRRNTALMAVSVTKAPVFAMSGSRMLFEGRFFHREASSPDYDVFPDDQRFIMLQELENRGSPTFQVVLNWMHEPPPASR